MTDMDTTVAAARRPEDAPAGFALFHYLRQAFRIIFWDNETVLNVSKDPRSLPYGLAFWAFATLVPVLVGVALRPAQPSGAGLDTIVLVLVILPFAALFEAARIGTCHLIAKLFFAGDGKFVELLRPLLLGSLVLALAAIPYVGVFIASIGFVAVLCLAFQEVDHVEPLQSYILCVVVSLVFLYVENELVTTLVRTALKMSPRPG